MRVSFRLSRQSSAGASARHNDRSYDHSHDRADDPNRYYVTNSWGILRPLKSGETFEQAERAYYQKQYADGLNARNARYRSKGHPDRVQTMGDLYTGKKTRPQQIILQIGDQYHHAGVEDLQKCLDDFLRTAEMRYGKNFHVLTAAIHLDEKTPHAQLSAVYDTTDRYGFLQVNQTQALKDLGYTAKGDRYNNATVDFCNALRGLWQEVVRDHGFEIETQPKARAHHLSTAEYKASQLQADIDNLEAEKHALEAENQSLKTEIQALKKRGTALQYRVDDLQQQVKDLSAQVVHSGRYGQYVDLQATHDRIHRTDDDER